jgi:hypothetical protein
MNTEESGDGLEPGKCNGLLRDGSGRRCRLPAGHGTEHVGIGYCKRHGGNTATHKANAIKVQARMDVERLGARRDIHPAEALLEAVQFKAGEVAVWRHKVSQLEESDLTWGVTKEVEGFSPEQGGMVNATTREAKPHIFLAQLHENEKALVEFSTAAIRAGAEMMLVRAAENWGNVWLDAMRAMLADPRVTVVGNPDDVLFDALKALRTR